MVSDTSDRRRQGPVDDATRSASDRISGGVARPRDERASRWSLERRLPVLLSLLLAIVIGGLSLGAYGEVRGSAISLATERLERMSRELAASAGRSTTIRGEALRALAADDVIVRAMAGRAPQHEVEARVAASREPGDSTLIGWH